MCSTKTGLIHFAISEDVKTCVSVLTYIMNLGLERDVGASNRNKSSTYPPLLSTERLCCNGEDIVHISSQRGGMLQWFLIMQV